MLNSLIYLAPRARLSAKLVWVPFRLFNDSYQEKHTHDKLFYFQRVKISFKWVKSSTIDTIYLEIPSYSIAILRVFLTVMLLQIVFFTQYLTVE